MKLFYAAWIRRVMLVCSGILVGLMLLSARRALAFNRYGRLSPTASSDKDARYKQFERVPPGTWSESISSKLKADVTVEGTVKDENGSPLPGVTVQAIGEEGVGTVTDAGGHFKLTVRDSHAKLEFSFIGYDKQVQSLNGRTTLSVVLHLSSASLKEAVIIGHQTTTQRLTTAAVTTVSGKEIENLPAPSFANLLQGKVAGVNIQNYSGEPGVRNTFVVRGNTNLSSDLTEAQALSTPLFVIDGVPTNLDDISTFDNTGTDVLAGINVNDIASIQVEKDAAATAAWGSRGANGVVIITTKRGVGETPQFALNFYTGVTQKPAALPTVVGAEERTQKMDLLYAYGTYKQLGGYDVNGNTGLYIMHNSIPQMLTDSLNPSFNNATDWQGLFYRTGIIHNVDASMSAAGKMMDYRVSLNYYDEDGVIISSGFKRYTLRGNFDFHISKKLSAQLNTSASRADRKRGIGATPFGNPFPLDAANLPSSFYGLDKADSLRYQGLYNGVRDKNQNDAYTGFGALNYDIIPGLRYTFQGSVSSQLSKRDQFTPSIFNHGENYAESDNSTFSQYDLSNILTYTKTFNKTHHLAVTATQSFQKQEKYFTAASGYNLPSDVVLVATQIPQQFTYGNSFDNTKTTFQYSDYQASSLLSYIGQLQYDYKEKYVLAAVWRADASSRFGKDTKWGYFPSVSAAWLASEEPFFKQASDWMDLLKFRVSWGRSGKQPDAFYAPFNSYDLGSGFYNGVSAVTPDYSNGLTQDSLTWATTTQWDAGVDLYLFDNRLNITLDYYDKRTNNDFFTFQFPFYIGYKSQTSNAPLGIKNNGFEINISTRNFPAQHPFQWNTNFNISYNHNVIFSLPNNNQSFMGYSYTSNGLGQDYVFTVGQPVYEVAQVVYQGVYNNASQIPVNPATGGHLTYFNGGVQVVPGLPIWKDVNKKYDVWMGDVVPTMDPNPKFTGGFNNDFSYKRFSLSISCNFTLGRGIINDALANQFASAFGNFYSPTNAPSQLVSFAETRLPDLRDLNYWLPSKASKDPSGYKAGFQSLNPYQSYFYQYNTETSEFNENGDYFRLQTIALGYQLPGELLNRLKVSMIKLYGVIDNVWLWQKATVPDAEQVDPFGQYNGNRYPIPKKWTLGANIQF